MSRAPGWEKWFALGRKSAARGDNLVAIQHYRRAIALENQNYAVYLEMGNAYISAGDAIHALECYREALRINPGSGVVWNNCGNMFYHFNDVDTAIIFYRNAAHLEPSDHGFHYNLGRTLDLAGQHDEALTHLLAACELDPSHADSWTNLGNAYHHLGRLDKALDCFDRALTLAEHTAEIHVNRATILLNHGDFAEGWSEYEHRWETLAFLVYKKMPFAGPQWKGESLAGKRIFLHAEQGFGDAIQFVRFIPEVVRRGAVVFMEVGAPLKPLMNDLLEPGHVLARGDPRPEYDFHCSLISLPSALNLQFNAIPAAPYLSAPYELRREARQALDQLSDNRSALRIGIAWTGSPTQRWNRIRSLDPSQFAPLAAVAGVEWFSLQRDAPAKDLAALPHDFGLRTLPANHLDGFMAVAAVIQELDLVVSVDTATAHLAGALGKPLWLLLPAFHEWRWHSYLDYSPWYPSARLFRQHRPGIWTEAIETVAAELIKLVDKQQRSPS